MSETQDKLKELGIATPQESIAKAIEHLTSKERIKLMSSLKHESDVMRFGLMYSVGEELNYGWLVNCADALLQLRVSLDKGRGRRDVVEVVKQPKVEGQGITDKIKSFVKGGE